MSAEFAVHWGREFFQNEREPLQILVFGDFRRLTECGPGSGDAEIIGSVSV